MIASMGWFRRGYSTATAYTLPSSTYTAYEPYTYIVYDAPKAEPPDPKKRIPFYRALFNQDFPPPIHSASLIPKRQSWRPNMGRVRINRTHPQ